MRNEMRQDDLSHPLSKQWLCKFRKYASWYVHATGPQGRISIFQVLLMNRHTLEQKSKHAYQLTNTVFRY